MKKQTIIIFCGHDKSGKSTISKELSKRINIPVFKVERDKYDWSPDNNLKYGTEQITQFLEQTGASVILDRWHPCDYMYSILFGRAFDLEHVKDIDLRLSKLNTVIIYCHKQKKDYEPDPEDADFIDMSQYSEMTALYETFDEKHSACTSLWLDTSNRDLEDQIKRILNVINL